MSERSLRASIAHSVAGSVTATVSAAVAGVLIARYQGPSLRGQYAAVTAWFGWALIIGEVGQPAAICYYVASEPSKARDFLATSRRMMIVSGGVVGIASWWIAPYLGHNDSALTWSYRILLGSVPISFAGGSYVAALQASDIVQWNLAKVVQPAFYLGTIVVLVFSHRLTLLTAVVALVGAFAVQLAFAYWACVRRGLRGGRSSSADARPLSKYGLTQALSTAPTSINLSLDQIVLSQAVSAADLGRYAVATSITSLTLPLIAPVGYVLFPHLARLGTKAADSHLLRRRALIPTFVVSVVIMAGIVVGSTSLLPSVFGHGYASAIRLVWVLAPGGILVACNQVLGDMLRGANRAIWVAKSQLLGAVITIVLLIALVPPLGVLGAAVTTSIAYAAVFAVMLVVSLARPGPRAIQSRTATPSGKLGTRSSTPVRRDR